MMADFSTKDASYLWPAHFSAAEGNTPILKGGESEKAAPPGFKISCFPGEDQSAGPLGAGGGDDITQHKGGRPGTYCNSIIIMPPMN
jgi:hypothetical protein